MSFHDIKFNVKCIKGKTVHKGGIGSIKSTLELSTGYMVQKRFWITKKESSWGLLRKHLEEP